MNFLADTKQERGERGKYSKLLARLQLGHFLHVDPDALAVKQHEVDGFDARRHGGHKVAGDGLKDQLGRRLLRKTVPDTKGRTCLVTCGQMHGGCCLNFFFLLSLF